MCACVGVKAQTSVEFLTPQIVRVCKVPNAECGMRNAECVVTSGNHAELNGSLVVTLEGQNPKVSVSTKGGTTTYKSSVLQVVVDEEGTVSFLDRAGNILLREGESRFTLRTEGLDAGSYRCYQSFKLDPDETFYGLGLLQNGRMSQRGTYKYMIQGNTDDVVPVLHSVKGYGIYWDNYSPTDFRDEGPQTVFDSEVGDKIDYYFMYGANADGVIAQMRELSGDAPLFPLWSYGYWQSKERYESADELLAVLDMYRELEVPIDGIVQDWQYWGSHYLWNAMDFIGESFSNWQNMMKKVHEQNAHMIITVWSSFGPMTLQHREMKAKNMLLEFETWPQSGLTAWPPNLDYPSGVRTYDCYNPEARDIYWKYLREGLFDKGMDGWWMDSTEPDHINYKDSDLEQMTYLGSFRRVRNAYPLMCTGGVYEHQRELTNDKRVFILTRCAFAGQQRNGANLWSGDVASTWDVLRAQVPAGLNLTLTGIPHWNTDIGGFFAGAYNKTWNDGTASKNPAYQELYVRWLEFGTFTPMMRSHGTETPREIYAFGVKGEPVYDAIEKFIRLRYAFIPYIYSTSWEVTNNRGSFTRALFMDYKDDKRTWDINDEFMFGKQLLVAPILHAQYTDEVVAAVDEMSGWNEREADASAGSMLQVADGVDFNAIKQSTVYLPEGTDWWDFWSNAKYSGGQEVTLDTDLASLPLFLKAGSILPLGPDVQYIAEKSWDDLEVRVYPGADGAFTLYEDEGESYNYEHGAYSEIAFTWSDKNRTLTIANRKGTFPGMLNTRQFRVTLPTGETKTVNYEGRKVSVRF